MVRATLHHASGPQVGPGRAEQAADIEGAVVEEAMILSGQHGIEEHQRHVGQAHGAVLLAGPVVGAGQDLGLERGGADVVAVPGDARDALVVHLDPHALGRHAAPAAQVDVPGVARPPVLSGCARRVARLDVLEPGQRAGQVYSPHLETRHERLRPGVDIGGPAGLDALEARQRDRRVGDEGQYEPDDERERYQADDPPSRVGRPGREPRQLHRLNYAHPTGRMGSRRLFTVRREIPSEPRA